jgi:hypothetical protein
MRKAGKVWLAIMCVAGVAGAASTGKRNTITKAHPPVTALTTWMGACSGQTFVLGQAPSSSTASRRAQRSCSPVRDNDGMHFLSQPAPGVHRAADNWRETTRPKATPCSPCPPKAAGTCWRVAASELGGSIGVGRGSFSESNAVPSQVCSGAGLRTVMHPMHPMRPTHPMHPMLQQATCALTVAAPVIDRVHGRLKRSPAHSQRRALFQLSFGLHAAP